MQHFRVCVCDCARLFVLVGNAFKINKNPQREQLSEKRSNRQGQEAWSAKERGEGEKGAMNEELEQALRHCILCYLHFFVPLFLARHMKAKLRGSANTHTLAVGAKNGRVSSQRNTSFEQSAKKCILYADAGRKLQLRTK